VASEPVSAEAGPSPKDHFVGRLIGIDAKSELLCEELRRMHRQLAALCVAVLDNRVGALCI
jgi:hypothetical protein